MENFPVFLAAMAIAIPIVSACGTADPAPFAATGFNGTSVLPPCTFLCGSTGATGTTGSATTGSTGSTGTTR